MTSVIVVGLGAMGSATAQHLAEQGHQVLGFDQFTPPHKQGSSHGETRIIRQSYWEDPRYVPLLLRAYEIWQRLEVDTSQHLLHLTGGLMIGSSNGDLVAGSTRSAKQFDLQHEILSASEIRRRFPSFRVEDATVALWETNAGYLLPELCIQQQLNQATRAGATFHYNEPVLEWEATQEGGVSVRTAHGNYSADRLVVTVGPWAPQILREMQLPLQVTRQVLYWFDPVSQPELFHESNFPIYIMEGQPGQPLLYGFPFTSPGYDGLKVGLHGSTEICTPETVVRTIRAQDEQTIRTRLADALPLLAGRLLRAETCLYTMTPDEHFLIDKHPLLSQVTLAAGFSGHGFKFASVIGEILANLATDQPTGYDLDLFSLGRFTSKINRDTNTQSVPQGVT